ncbi:MAG: hypothetical protein C5B52_08145 [Bacteroidetes bacterium]|nr:MAG: hypothetical protein C5B52_08145 [Bacteroidota bacterium]
MKKMRLLFLSVWICSNLFVASAQNTLRPDSVLKQMTRVADWQLWSWEKEGMRWPKYDWTNAACYAGFMALNKVANDSKYSKAMYNIGNALNWNTGPRKGMADDYCVGQMYSQMYSLFKDPIIISQWRMQADSLATLSHEEGLEWKDNIALREWGWCDALFMGPPALAYLSSATGDRKYLDLANKLWWKTTDYLYDKEEHLYYRDSRFFTRREANGKKMFWSRGNGWVMGGLVRVLENMPSDYSDRGKFIQLYRDMAEKIASVQHQDGSWHAALLDSVSYPPKETSGTGFYCYALAWGINHGILSYEKYFPVVAKAWTALSSSIHPNGKLGFVQQIGEKPESVDFNSTEVYGVGSFLLAGSELIDLLMKHSGKNYISIENNTGVNLEEEVVEIPFQKFSEKFKVNKDKKFKVENAITGSEIPYQLEYKGEKTPGNILLLVGLAPGAKNYLQVSETSPSAVETKTYGRYVPERYDDFAWENDRIAFRVYGTALEKTNENAYGIDVWSKRTPALLIDKWYKSGDYHVDHGEGLDLYHVGFTLGAGNSAPFVNDSIYYSKNYRRYQVLDNGPLRTSFKLEYDSWNANGIAVSNSKIISLDAGSQLNKIEVTYNFKSDKPLPIAIGIVKRAGNGNIWIDEKNSIVGYWEPATGKDGTMGIGTIVELPATFRTTSNHLLTILNSTPSKAITYYSGAAWDKAGIIKNQQDWFNYLRDFKIKIDNPISITW